MSNTETIELAQDQWSTRELTDAQQKNRASAEMIPFGSGTGVTPQTFAAAVDLAKMMSTARNAVPPHLIGNTGACLAIIDIAASFQMKAYMLATRCYVVNGMLAFDGQAILAIMNTHMPLTKDENGKKTRLKYKFEGEHAVYEPQEIDEVDERTNAKTGKRIWISKLVRPSTRKVIVSGRMENEADDLVYESPTVFNIKNKKSPLWVEDEDQQLIYWASRRWQRRHWPEGLLGIYAPDELADQSFGADNAKLIQNSDNPGQALLERVAAAKAQTADADQMTGVREGFTKDHAHNETNGISTEEAANCAAALADAKSRATTETKPIEVIDKVTGEVTTVEKLATEQADAAEQEQAEAAGAVEEPEHEVLPKTVAEWKVYCIAWINEAKTDPKVTYDDMVKHWKAETGLRNDCGVSNDDKTRDEVYDYFLTVRDDKPKTETEKAASKRKPK